MTLGGQLTLTFLLATAVTAVFSGAARAQLLLPQPGTPGQTRTMPSPQPSPVEPPFAPQIGPYTPPPPEALPERPAPPPFLSKGGRATIPTAQTARLLLTPSITIDEAYTDNVFLDNDFKRSDFITSFTPGLLLGLRTTDFGLGAGYVFTSEIYAKETELTDALARWAGSVAAFYSFTPQLRLDVQAAYYEDNNATGSAIAGVSTGRTRSRGAAVAPTLLWQFDPLTTVQLQGAWYRQTFDEREDQFASAALSDYDTYIVSPNVARRITPNLTVTFQYQYLASDYAVGEDFASSLFLPGVIYQIAPDLAATLNVGPQVVTTGQTGTSVAAQFGLTKTFRWGSIGLSASHAEVPTGGLGGSAETTTVGLAATIANLLLPGLTVSLSPSYTNAKGDGTLGTTNSVGLEVLATYPVTRWMSAFLAYSYFRQRTTGSDLNDIDANRVTAGIQLFEAIRLR
jgi:hypothetical protein